MLILMYLISNSIFKIRSLPAVSYLTSLDAYQIASSFFICLIATWHAIVGAPHLLDPDVALNADSWMLMVFGIIYACMQIFWAVWLFYAYDKVRKISAAEKDYFAKHKDHFIPCKQTYANHNHRNSVANFLHRQSKV